TAAESDRLFAEPVAHNRHIEANSNPVGLECAEHRHGKGEAGTGANGTDPDRGADAGHPAAAHAAPETQSGPVAAATGSITTESAPWLYHANTHSQGPG